MTRALSPLLPFALAAAVIGCERRPWQAPANVTSCVGVISGPIRSLDSNGNREFTLSPTDCAKVIALLADNTPSQRHYGLSGEAVVIEFSEPDGRRTIIEVKFPNARRGTTHFIWADDSSFDISPQAASAVCDVCWAAGTE